MELAGDIGRRDHDGIGGLVRFPFRVEVFSFQPGFIDPILYVFGIVYFFQLFSHGRTWFL